MNQHSQKPDIQLVGQVFKALREEQGITSLKQMVELVSEHVGPGYHQSSISKVERGSGEARWIVIYGMLRALKVPLSYVVSKAMNDSARPQVECPSVPVFSWLNSGLPSFNNQPLEYLPAPSQHFPEDGFAVKVFNRAMCSPEGPSLPPGCIAFIEPTATFATGDVVLAHNTKDDSYILRRYERDGTASFLTPLNDQFPTIELTSNYKALGKVTSCVNFW